MADADVINIAALVWCIDPIIKVIHPPNRQGSSWCNRNRTGSRLGQNMTVAEVRENPGMRLKGRERPTIKEGLQEILKCADFGETALLMSSRVGEDAYNFKFYRRLGQNGTTIEFRQAAGTMNGE